MKTPLPAEAPRHGGPCVRCVVSAVIGVVVSGWMLMVLIRVIRWALRRS
jgi:hypothetical protein